MPTLKNLNIGTNFIVRVRPLRKLQCLGLGILHLCSQFNSLVDNPITDFESLSLTLMEPCVD